MKLQFTYIEPEVIERVMDLLDHENVGYIRVSTGKFGVQIDGLQFDSLDAMSVGLDALTYALNEQAEVERTTQEIEDGIAIPPGRARR